MPDDQNEFAPFGQLEGPPKGYFVVIPGNVAAQILDVTKIGFVLRSSWKLILGVAVLAAVTSAVVTLQMRNVYRAVVLIAPVSRGNANSLRNQLGGLAALAGIDVGEAGSRRAESLATLTSTALARQFIADQDLLPILYASRWDAQASRWHDGKPPAMDAAVKKLATSVVMVSENRNNGIVTVAAEWYSPELAARWANRMVEMANDKLRAEATVNAERRIDFLKKELDKTGVEAMRLAIYRLIEDQLNNAMLANVEREYAYHVIDPAVPPQQKFAPKRAVITVLGGFGGLLLGVIFVFARRLFLRTSARSVEREAIRS